MGKEGSHVGMARWLLGCVNVLAARKHNAARASDKRHAVEPMARECLHRTQADTAVANTALENRKLINRMPCSGDGLR